MSKVLGSSDSTPSVASEEKAAHVGSTPDPEQGNHPSKHEDAFVPPNGGFKASTCVLGSFLLQFCSFGYINACRIFQYHYAAVRLPDKPSSILAWIATLQIFLLFMCGPAIGQLIDGYGARCITIPFSVLTVFCVCMVSLCTKYRQIMLSQGIGFGIAASGISMPALLLTTQWFSTHRGFATGIVAAGSSLGGVTYPFMIPRLIKSVGFASAVRWTALIQGILLLIANLLISTPFKPNGFQKKEATDFSAFKPLPWLFLVLGCFFSMWGLFAPLNYLPEMAAQFGVSVQNAQYTIAVANAGSMIGRIVPGFVADRLGHFNMMVIVSLLSGIVILAFWIPLAYHPSLDAIYVFALLYGFTSGGFVSLGLPCVANLNQGRLERMGVQLGGFCLAVALGALTGLPIEGHIKDRSGVGCGRVGLMIFAGTVLFVGGLCILVAGVSFRGWKFWTKV